MTARGLIRPMLARARADAAVLATVGAVVVVAAAVLTGVPRALVGLADRALADTVERAPAHLRGVRISQGGPLRAVVGETPAAAVPRVGTMHRDALPPALRDLLGPPQVHVSTSRWRHEPWPGDPVPGPTWVSLHVLPGADDHAQLVAGRWPERTSQRLVVDEPVLDIEQIPVLELAVSRETADTMRWEVGDELLLTMTQQDAVELRIGFFGRRPLVLRVVGVFEPTDVLEDPFWWGDGRLHSPGVQPTLSATIFFTHGLLAPEAYADLVKPSEPFVLSNEWRFELLTDRLSPGRLAAVRGGVAQAEAARLGSGAGDRATVSTNLDVILARHAARVSATMTTLTVAIYALLGLTIALIALVGALLATRRRPTTALLRGRGASAAQVLGIGAVEAVTVAGLAAAAGAAAAVVAIAGRSTIAGPPLALVIGVTTVLTAVAVPTARRPLAEVLRESTGRTPATRGRVVAGVVTLGLATAAVLLLRTRGLHAREALAAGGGADPLLAAAPLLLVAAAAIIVVPVTMVALRLAARRAARRDDLVAVFAAWTSSRQPERVLPALAVLLIGSAVAGFTGSILDTVRTGQVHGAWAEAGAAHRVESITGQPLPADLLAALDASAVTASTQQVPARVAGRSTTATLIGIDVAGLDALLADVPGAQPLPASLRQPLRTDSAIPALASRAFLREAGLRTGDRIEISGAGVTLVATRDRVAGRPADEPWLLASARDVEQITGVVSAPTIVLVAASSSTAIDDLVSEHGGAVAVHAERLIAQARSSPLTAGLMDGFRVATVLAGGLGVLGLAVGVVLLSRRESRELALLDVIGASRVERAAVVRRRLLVLVGIGTIGGVALGIGAVALLAPAIDLAGVAGLPTAISARPGPVTLATLAGTLASTTTLVLIRSRTVVRTDAATELRRSDL